MPSPEGGMEGMERCLSKALNWGRKRGSSKETWDSVRTKKRKSEWMLRSAKQGQLGKALWPLEGRLIFQVVIVLI